MSMKKPDATYPNAPTSSSSPMPMQIPDPSILGISHDQVLRNRGIRVIHQKALPCPNMPSLNTNAHEPGCPHCDDSGMIYYTSQEITGHFSGNGIEKTFEAHGIWEIGTAVMSFPTEYADGTQAEFNTFDRLTFPDFTVRLWELKEYEPRDDDKQKLRYPIENVDHAMSIVNGVPKIYQPGVDFNIDEDGSITWIAGKEPAYNFAQEKGQVISWSYFARPVYVVLQSMRELRITQEMDANGQKRARRLPQQVLVRRDFMVNTAEKIST